MAKTKPAVTRAALTAAAPVDPVPDPTPVDTTPPVEAKPVQRPAIATALAEPLITVEDLLSRAASHHEGYRRSLETNRPADVQTFLQLALDAREAAQALDPTLLDPAWTTHERTHPHLQLLAFYRQQVHG